MPNDTLKPSFSKHKFHLSGLFFYIVAMLISGCFPENKTYQPKIIDGQVGEIGNSIYEYQTFYSLEDNQESANNLVSDWDLGFECGANGESVILNSGDILSIYNAGAVEFSTAIEIPTDAQWIYDASSGNNDSLVVNNWVNTSAEPYAYSHDVFIIRKNNEPFKKFKLIELSENSYRLVVSPLQNFSPDTIIVAKQEGINYQKLSLQNQNAIVKIEPNTSDWDLQFTTYQSIIPDDDGVLTPYVVRGVLHNPHQTEVGFYYISDDDVPFLDPSYKDQEETALEEYFLQLTIDDVQNIPFTSTLDAIGYDWKDVVIDYESGSAVYASNTRNIYIVKSQNGSLYKMRFISFYDASGQKGFPTIHYLKMN